MSLDKPCLLWQGAQSRGYGNRRYKGKVMGAHVVAVLEDGREVPPGMCVRHACDVRLCIEPTHLIVGTDQENMIDKAHRSPRSSVCKLFPEQVSEIRALLGSMTQKEIARRFGVHRSTVSFIKTGRYWSHVEEAPCH